MKILVILSFVFLCLVYGVIVAFIIKVLSYKENRETFLSILGILIIIVGGIGLSILWYYGHPFR